MRRGALFAIGIADLSADRVLLVANECNSSATQSGGSSGGGRKKNIFVISPARQHFAGIFRARGINK